MKINLFKVLKWTSGIFIAILCFGMFNANAQTGSPGPQSYYSPRGLLDTVVDNLGHRFSLGEIAINDFVRTAARGGEATLATRATCSSGYFQLFYDSACGVTPGSPEANVICQVFHDISGMIRSPCTSTGQKINIWVRNLGAIIGSSGITGAAGIATPFYNLPYSTAISGIADNTIWITANSGTDAYAGVTSPVYTTSGSSSGSTFFHGQMGFNFDTGTHWHTDLTTSTGYGELDLYTVVLHEVMHSLGFTSLINYNGLSKFGAGFSYFNRYDTYLKIDSSATWVSLLTRISAATGGCDLYDWEFNPSHTPVSILSPGGTSIASCTAGYLGAGYPPVDYTNCTNAVNYVDGAMSPIPVFTPDCYSASSSLAHFEDMCLPSGHSFLTSHSSISPNNQYFAMSNGVVGGPYNSSTNPGAMKRYLTPEERQVLCDIGYTVDTVFGDSSNLNYKIYSGGVCGVSVAGINDGIDSNGAYTYFTTGTTPININAPGMRLLSNDYGVSAPGSGFQCLQLISGSGSVSLGSGSDTSTVNFTPASGSHGVQLLRYVPVNPSGIKGNITYVYVYVGDSNCIPSACDLVSNGSFEHAPSPECGSVEFGYQTNCWSDFSGTCDYMARSCYFDHLSIPNSWLCNPATDAHLYSSGTNNHFAGFQSGGYTIGGAFHNYIMESMQSPLSSSLDSGYTYIVSCWAKLAKPNDTSTSPIQNTHLGFFVSPSLTPLATVPAYTSAMPSYLTTLCSFELSRPDTAWHYYDTTLTYNGPTGNTLVVAPARWLDPTSYVPLHNYIFVDDISIRRVVAVCSFSLPDSVVLCTGVSTIDLDSFVSIPGGTFSWQTLTGGTLNTSHSHILSLHDALQASQFVGGHDSVLIDYEYTNALGCGMHVNKYIWIKQAPYTVRVYPNPVCAGDTTTFICSGLPSYSYTWTPGVTCSSGVCDRVTVVPTVTTTYTVTETATGCTDVFVLHVDHYPSAGAIIAPLLCSGSSVSLYDSVSGGFWMSSDPLIGVFYLPSSSAMHCRFPGTITVSYFVTNSCGTAVATAILTIGGHSHAGTITGSTTLCEGFTTTLSDTTTGGTWRSNDTSVATIDSSGTVTGIAAGSAIITYSVRNGCDTALAYLYLTIEPSPASITGATSLCVGATTTLGNATTGGTWTSSNPGIATVGSTSGIVTAMGVGTATITYSLTATGCYTIRTITINPFPFAGTISSASPICAGATMMLTDTAVGGTWSSSSAGIATISTTGVVTGVSGGAATISYTVSNSCGTAWDTMVVTVNPLPTVITGTTTICEGENTPLSDADTGGTWSVSDVTVATIDPYSGMLTGISAGIAVVTYSFSTGCYITTALTVNIAPLPITGLTSFCAGGTAVLTDATPSGTWSTGSLFIASVDMVTGMVTAMTPGTTTVSYTLATGCSATTTISVDTIPVLVTSPDMVYCGGTGITLGAYVGGAHAPVSGYTYSWLPPAGLSAANIYNPVATPTVTTQYEITVTTNSSGCSAVDTVTIYVLSGSTCNPCSDFGSAPFVVLGRSGNVHANVGPGNYFIPADVHVSGNITFTDAVIEVENNAKIYVNSGSSLKVEGSHLYSCANGMWNGIVLGNTSDTLGTLVLTGDTGGHSTLIEDATVGVNAQSTVTPVLLPGTPYYLLCDNVIFNRNNTGIYLSSLTTAYSGTATDSFSYPVRIVNSVFTGRDFSVFTVSSLSYPYNWPNTTGLYGLKTGYTPSTSDPVRGPYMAPFNIANPHAGPGGVAYAGRLCHDGSHPRYGINVTATGAGTAPRFTSLVIGDTAVAYPANPERNLFDTLEIGIRASNSNVIVHNCSFMNPFFSPGGVKGVGVWGHDGASSQLILEPVGSALNYFYNCRKAMHTTSYNRVRSNGSWVTSYNNSWDASFPVCAFYVEGRGYELIDISGNLVTNMKTGVYVKMANLSGWPTAYTGPPGQVYITANTIRPNTGASGTLRGFVSEGVWVDNPIGTYGYATTNSLIIDDNYLSEVYNGIIVNSVSDQLVTSNRNTIYMRDSMYTAHIGIQHTGCFKNQVRFNNVYGHNYQNELMTAIFTQYCTNHVVECNLTSQVGRGFEFNNISLPCRWRGNTMNNCGKGFVLSTSAIGTQGHYGLESNNRWTATGGFGWSLWTGCYQTFNEFGSLPTGSPLYVSHGSLLDPQINEERTHFCPRTYGCDSTTDTAKGNGNGLIVTSAPLTYKIECDLIKQTNNDNLNVVAAGNMGGLFIDYHRQHNWTAQNNLWEAMAHDDTVSSLSDTLAAFRLAADGSRYTFLSQIEGILADGDALTPQLMLGATGIQDYANTNIDSTTGVVITDSINAETDTIVANYRRYYGMYSRYLDSTFSIFDSLALDTLASSCPITNGAVVYKARALYNIVFNTLRIFDNNCGYPAFVADSIITDSTIVMDSVMDDSTANRIGYGENRLKTASGTQRYELFPNPNDGEFVLTQAMPDTEPIQIEVWDAIGKVTLKQKIVFNNPTARVFLKNVPPGLYLLKVRDSNGNNFILKFVVQ